jgi:hypothetical protein
MLQTIRQWDPKDEGLEAMFLCIILAISTKVAEKGTTVRTLQWFIWIVCDQVHVALLAGSIVPLPTTWYDWTIRGFGQTNDACAVLKGFLCHALRDGKIIFSCIK